MAENIDINIQGTPEEQIAILAKELRRLRKELKGVTASTKKYKDANKVLKTRIDKLNGSLGILGTRNQRNGMTFSVLRSKILMFNFAMAMSIGKIMSMVKAAGAQERALAAVAQVLKTTEYASGMTNESIIALSDSIEESVGVASQLVLESSALLLTFTNIADEVFPRAQESIIDVTAAMYQGTLSSENLKTTTIQLGKALNDPIKGMNALNRVGIQFSGVQKRQIAGFVHTGRLAKAQAIILKELEKQFGGMGEAIKDTTEGKLMALNTALGNLSRRIGESLAPRVDELLDSLTAFIDGLQPGEIMKFVVSLTSATVAIKVLNSFILTNSKLMAVQFLAAGRSASAWRLLKRGWVAADIAGKRLLVTQKLLIASGWGAAMLILTPFISKMLGATGAFQDQDVAAKKATETLEEYQARISGMTYDKMQVELKKAELRLMQAGIAVKYWADKTKELQTVDMTNKQQVYFLLASQGKLKAKLVKDEETGIWSLNKQQLAAGTAYIKAVSGNSEHERMMTQALDKLKRKGSDIELKAIAQHHKNSIAAKDVELAKQKALLELMNDPTYIKHLNSLGLESDAVIKIRENLELLDAQYNAVTQTRMVGGKEVEMSGKTYGKIMKMAKDLNLTFKDLMSQDPKNKMVHNLVELQVAYDNTVQNAKERAQALKSIQKDVTGFISSQHKLIGQIAQEEYDKDIKRIEKSGAYKRAQEQGNQKKMDQLKKGARDKFVKEKKKEFRQNQVLASSTLVIDYMMAIGKEYGMKGLLGGLVASPWLMAQLAMSVAAVWAQPTPKFAKGGDYITDGPQMIMVGDNPGGRERVQVTPLSSPNEEGPQGGGNVNITFTGNVMSQDFIEQEAIPQIKEAIRRGADIGIS